MALQNPLGVSCLVAGFLRYFTPSTVVPVVGTLWCVSHISARNIYIRMTGMSENPSDIARVAYAVFSVVNALAHVEAIHQFAEIPRSDLRGIGMAIYGCELVFNHFEKVFNETRQATNAPE